MTHKISSIFFMLKISSFNIKFIWQTCSSEIFEISHTCYFITDVITFINQAHDNSTDCHKDIYWNRVWQIILIKVLQLLKLNGFTSYCIVSQLLVANEASRDLLFNPTFYFTFFAKQNFNRLGFYSISLGFALMASFLLSIRFECVF